MPPLLINEKNILDQIPNPVFIKSADGSFVYVNQHFLDLFGISKTEVLGNIFLKDVPFFSSSELHTIYLNEKQQHTCEPFSIERNGQVSWYQVSLSSFSVSESEHGKMGVISDVSARIVAQRELEVKTQFETAINHVSQAVLALQEEEAIISTFVQGMFKQFGLEDCVVYLRSEHDDNYLIKAYGLSKGSTGNIPIEGQYIDKGVVGRAARTWDTQLVNDTTKDPDYFSEVIHGMSEIAVPIVHQYKLLGVLDSEHSEKNFFSGTYKRTFETCASLLGVKVTQARALKGLQQQKAYLDQVLESPKEMSFYSVDENFNYKYFNTRHRLNMRVIWGTDVRIGSSILQNITTPKDRLLAEKHLQRAMDGEEFTLVHQYGGRDDSRRYWEDVYSPYYNIDGSIEGVSVFTRDVTTIIEDRQKLQESEQLLLSIYENIPSGMFRTTVGGAIHYANTAMVNLFGYSEAELKDLQLRDLFASSESYDELLADLNKKHLVNGFETKLKKKTGETFVGLLNISFWVSLEGIRKVDGAITDLSELHRTKTVLEENNKKLEKINAELDHIVYRTSHDLRSPVASMLGLMQLIEPPEDMMGQQYLSLLNQQIVRLDGIIQDIVNYRKVAAVGIDPKEIRVEEMVQQVFKDLAYLNDCEAINKSVMVTNTSGQVMVTDPFNLEIILNNLLSNAVKYSDRSKAERFIKVHVEIQPEKSSLVIEDNGIGISQKYHDKVFDMFFRATTSNNGTGLGLFILKEALDKLQGSVSLDSTEGVGTTFVLQIPHLTQASA